MLIDFKINKDIFFKEYLYKKPYLFKKSLETSQFNWDDVNEIYSRADYSHRDFKIMNGYEVSKAEYLETYNNLGVIEYNCIKSVLYNYLRNGATLVRNRISNEPIIDSISRQISNFAEAHSITGGYAAFSSKSSYKAHWDTRDVYAVQLLGRKRWILKAPNFASPLFMQQTKDFPNIEEPKEIYMDIILEAGDILYIPRGWWHDPLPLDEETFHIAVATFAPTGYEYIKWLLNKVPDILGSRSNLKCYDDDINNLDEISKAFTNMILSKDNYDEFLISHYAEQRIKTKISLDFLGNAKKNYLEDDVVLKLNSNNIYLFKDNKYIINGNAIQVDDSSKEIISKIFKHERMSVSDIIEMSEDKSKTRNLLFDLLINDIVSKV